MSKITIDLIEEGKLRTLLIKFNKIQEKNNKPTFTIEEFVSMLLATPEFLETIDMLSKLFEELKEEDNK